MNIGKIALQVVSWIAAGFTILPSFIYLGGSMELPTMKTIMLVSTLVWFIVTPLWMERGKA